MTPTPQDAEAVAQAREALVRVLQAAHISCEPSTFYDLAETLGVTFPPTEHQIADALFAAVRVEGARDALTRFVKERREGTASDDQWDMLCDLERFRDREYPAPTERKGAQECPCGRVRQLCGTVGCSNPAPTERKQYTEGIVLKPTEREATPPQAAPEPRIAKPSAQVSVGQKMVQRWDSDGFGRTWYRVVQKDFPNRDYGDFRAVLHAMMSNPPMPSAEEYAALLRLAQEAK